MIDVGEDGLRVRSPDGEQSLGWDQIEAAPRVHSSKGGLHFHGVEMASRFGRIRLDDDWYCNGRLAAAVVVRGVAQAHEAKQRAKIEGKGWRRGTWSWTGSSARSTTGWISGGAYRCRSARAA